jgi:hypothetical protein
VRKVWTELGRFTESRDDTRSVRRMQGDVASMGRVQVSLQRCVERYEGVGMAGKV